MRDPGSVAHVSGQAARLTERGPYAWRWAGGGGSPLSVQGSRKHRKNVSRSEWLCTSASAASVLVRAIAVHTACYSTHRRVCRTFRVPARQHKHHGPALPVVGRADLPPLCFSTSCAAGVACCMPCVAFVAAIHNGVATTSLRRAHRGLAQCCAGSSRAPVTARGWPRRCVFDGSFTS